MRTLTHRQILAWRENWGVADRELIEHALDLIPGRDYYEPASAAYAAVKADGRVALYIAPGYLYWPRGTWVADLDPRLIPGGLQQDDGGQWYALSTFRPHEAGKPEFEELRAPCPVCFVEYSVAGTCLCD